MKNSTYLLVYGTLRKGVGHPMHWILERYGICQGTGSFRGKLFDLGRFPGATASGNDSDCVVGEIYRLQRASKALAILDDYEGDLFQRTQVSARVNDRKTITAWTYLYTGTVKTHRRITSGDYIVFLNRS